MEPEELAQEIQRCGTPGEPLTRKRRGDLLQQWREVFAAPFYQKTGKWKHGQFEWHVFSFKYARALNGGRAEEAYKQEKPGQLIVIPEDVELPAYELVVRQLPVFSAFAGDVYLWPPDRAWTMAFTHEQNDGVGPYFSRREWTT